MRVLLDHNVPRKLRLMLPDHEVDSTGFRGWHGLKDDGLLRAAAVEYRVLVTLDQSMRFQQNIAAHDIAVVVLRSRTSRMVDIAPLVPKLLSTLSFAQPRRVYTVP